MDRLRRLLFCVVLVAVFLFDGCTGVPVKPAFESERVVDNAVEQQSDQMLSDSAFDVTSGTAEFASSETSDSIPEDSVYDAWEKIDWSQYDPQYELLQNEYRRVEDKVRGGWKWESFTLAGDIFNTFTKRIEPEPLDVFPQFPIEQPQISRRFARYLYTPYILPDFGENTTIMLQVAEDGSIKSSILSDKYHSQPRSACAVGSLVAPYYLFLTTDGKLMLGNVENSKTHQLYDFGFTPVVFNESIQAAQASIRVCGTLVYIQLENTQYCYYLPTGEMAELFTVDNFLGALPENTCELLYSAASQERLDFIAQGGDMDAWMGKSGSPIPCYSVVNLATQKATWQFEIFDRNFDVFPSAVWEERYILRKDHIRSWDIQ